MNDEKLECKVVRNDGQVYMECDRETARRLVRQLNEMYEGVYKYGVKMR
jgi:hypothetical protein